MALTQDIDAMVDGLGIRASLRPYEDLDPDLKQIRLLNVKAGQGQEDVNCELQVVSLLDESKPKYETISYVWGDPSAKGSVHLNGIRTEIGLAAEEVLRRFRLREHDRVLWIDAICIDQTNLAERGQQVAMMVDIYSNTTHGLIWLGEHGGDGVAAVQGVTAIYEEARAETENLERLYRTLYRNRRPRTSERTLSAEVDLGVVLGFYDAPWFQRLWCVQEAALANESTCYYGYLELPLMKALIAAQWLAFKRLQISFGLNDHPGLGCAAEIWAFADHDNGLYGRKSSARPNLRVLLRSVWAFRALDPRDHVFGLVGLYQKLIKPGRLPRHLQPDYTKPLVEVYRDATREAIMESRSLTIFLGMAVGRVEEHASEDRFPSWVHGWHRPWNKRLDAGELGYHFRADAATRVAFTQAQLDEPGRTISGHRCSDMNTLCVEGIMVEAINEVTETMRWGLLDGVVTILSIMGSVRDMLQRQAVARFRDEVESLLAMTLCAGTDCLQSPFREKDARRSLDSLYEFTLRTGHLPPQLGLPEAGNATAEDTQASQYYYAMYNACSNRRAFTTESAHSGLGPRTTRRGDIIAVLYGCPWPVILRPRQESGHFELLDVAYVSGIMHGEAVREHKAAGKRNDVFHIH